MKRGATEAETCRLNGWQVGTRLVGDEGYGPTIIRITAIGKSSLLAQCISHNGIPDNRSEDMWTLRCRDWERVGPTTSAAGSAATTRRTP